MEGDPRAELATLVAEIRTNLALRKRSGLAGVPGTRTNTRTRTITRTGTEEERAPSSSSSSSSSPSSSPIPSASEGLARLKLVRDDLGDCTRCGLAKGRQKLVFGVGNPDAHLVFVGEAPGADEDAQGEPFVG